MSKHHEKRDKRDDEIADLKKRLAKAKSQRDRAAKMAHQMEEDIRVFLSPLGDDRLVDRWGRLRRWVS